MATVTITQDNLASTIEKNDIVILDFWASWCGPCKAFAPVFEQASKEHEDIVFGKVDTESQQALAASFQIRSIPTVMVFREGLPVFAQPGALPPQALVSLIEQVRALDMDDVRERYAKASAGQQDEA